MLQFVWSIIKQGIKGVSFSFWCNVCLFGCDLFGDGFLDELNLLGFVLYKFCFYHKLLIFSIFLVDIPRQDKEHINTSSLFNKEETNLIDLTSISMIDHHLCVHIVRETNWRVEIDRQIDQQLNDCNNILNSINQYTLLKIILPFEETTPATTYSIHETEHFD